ncbi:MAG: arginyl-tRNA synthetase [Parcubacteria group bacterium Gr01-1014_66]|nr:MAG: arginyl-tRNA synthetase [Parcubacteria group bacterium Gr01-1014_66]
MMREKIKALILDLDIIKSRYVGDFILDFSVIPSENPIHGDYSSNVAFVYVRDLARAMKAHTGNVLRPMGGELLPETPHNFAEKIKRELGGKEIDFIERIEVANPGFLNFFIAEKTIFEKLNEILARPENWGTSEIGRGKTVMVEYFQLNIAKRPHIGHIRSAIIGDALKRMLLSQGYHAVSDTHVGDWGTQFGILLLGYKEGGRDLHTQKIVGDPFGALEEIYVQENARIAKNPTRREEAKKEFAKLEQGDQENRKIWQWMVEVSMKNLETSAQHLGLLPFDEHCGESFYEDKMQPIVDLALEKGIAKKTDDSAIIVDLVADSLDEAVLIKSDGASTYLLRDLATIQYRKEQWKFWKNLYVVDVRQSHHFRQVFRVAELLGFEGEGKSEHVGYGFMRLPEGMMSTRAGTIISLEKVLDEAIAKARTIIQEKNPMLADTDKVAHTVGIGALKYFDLSHHRNSDIIFSWDRTLSFEGNTGPYLQYTYARLRSILRKANLQLATYYNSQLKTEMDSLERQLCVTLLRFPEAIEDALAILSPHVLAGHLYEFAKTVNEFYHTHPVLQEEDEGKKQFRLTLVFLTTETLKRGLYLLGIDAPEEM